MKCQQTIIGEIGTAGGTGYAIEFAGTAIANLSMEGRMTVCNMAIEAGARAGLIGVDDITIDYFVVGPMRLKVSIGLWQKECGKSYIQMKRQCLIKSLKLKPVPSSRK